MHFKPQIRQTAQVKSFQIKFRKFSSFLALTISLDVCRMPTRKRTLKPLIYLRQQPCRRCTAARAEVGRRGSCGAGRWRGSTGRGRSRRERAPTRGWWTSQAASRRRRRRRRSRSSAASRRRSDARRAPPRPPSTHSTHYCCTRSHRTALNTHHSLSLQLFLLVRYGSFTLHVAPLVVLCCLTSCKRINVKLYKTATV